MLAQQRFNEAHVREIRGPAGIKSTLAQQKEEEKKKLDDDFQRGLDQKNFERIKRDLMLKRKIKEGYQVNASQDIQTLSSPVKN